MSNSTISGRYNSNSVEQTEALGQKLAEHILSQGGPPALVLLCGEIGSGKTVFSRGIARALGIDEAIQSPTFPILLEYPGARCPLYHFDLYRLCDSEEFDLIGGPEILFSGGSYGAGLCLIEWPERLAEWDGNENAASSCGSWRASRCFRVTLHFAQAAQVESRNVEIGPGF